MFHGESEGPNPSMRTLLIASLVSRVGRTIGGAGPHVMVRPVDASKNPHRTTERDVYLKKQKLQINGISYQA